MTSDQHLSNMLEEDKKLSQEAEETAVQVEDQNMSFEQRCFRMELAKMFGINNFLACTGNIEGNLFECILPHSHINKQQK